MYVRKIQAIKTYLFSYSFEPDLRTMIYQTVRGYIACD
jgi:hypothetical protein